MVTPTGLARSRNFSALDWLTCTKRPTAARGVHNLLANLNFAPSAAIAVATKGSPTNLFGGSMAVPPTRPFYHLFEGPRGPRLIERHFSKIRKGVDCWEWTARINKCGYGMMRLAQYHLVGAHRVAWAIANRQDPHGKMVLHSCNNRRCCNPDHLRLGDAADNVADMLNAGTASNGDRSGEANPMAKLSPEDVAATVALIDQGLNNTQISDHFGVSHATISAIRTGKTWRRELQSLGRLPDPA